jgi:biopolymer transport protein TolQ
MDTSIVTAVELGADAVAHGFSPWQLFVQADIVVKAVILLLAACSFWSWAIIFEKVTRYRRIARQAAEFENMFWSGGSLQQLYDNLQEQASHPMARLFESAMREWQRFSEGDSQRLDAARLEGLHRRIAHAMDVTLDRELDQLQKYLGFLATVGSTAPFVGLFGTVWGIINSFQSIAVSKDTSLAVVAPGIAEALFATALGLVAAIPAVVAYNKLSGDLDRYSGRLESFGTEFRSLMSRQLEERVV